MIYRSNLDAPNLAPHFLHMISMPRPWSFGHDVPSDRDFEPDCGSLTHDEAAILYHCAMAICGEWVDIGARFGWTAAHIIKSGSYVNLVDPGFARSDYMMRMANNLHNLWISLDSAWAKTASEFFNELTPREHAFDGFMIDGNHDSPEPLNDAMNAVRFAEDTCCIVFHDFWGQPIRDAVTWLMAKDWSARVYYTPNGMAVCWRGDFTPPHHEPDPFICMQQSPDKFPDFDFSRLK
jgi:hypothetical protein